jgi:hypothetical protein
VSYHLQPLDSSSAGIPLVSLASLSRYHQSSRHSLLVAKRPQNSNCECESMCFLRISARAHRISVRKALAYRVFLRAFASSRLLSSKPTQPFQPGPPMDMATHRCDMDAEPLHRYRRGGYHPIHLGDFLNNGRYRILHKLGWGGYSTVWAARDLRSHFLRYSKNIRTDRLPGNKPVLLSKSRFPSQTIRLEKLPFYVPLRRRIRPSLAISTV